MHYRLGLVLICLSSLLLARENPFSSAINPADIGKATLKKEEKIEFDTGKISLPSSARILKSASVTFQNLDGSISEEIIAINKEVNWHYPLILSSQKPQMVEKPSEVVTEKTPSEVPKNNMIKEERKTEKKEEVIAIKSFSNVVLNENIELEIEEKSIRIYTKDKKIRDFIVSNPYKIVIDFEKKEGSFTTKTAAFSKAPFVSATLGNHEGFYRIAIVLDGQYRYSISSMEKGYVIGLK